MNAKGRLGFMAQVIAAYADLLDVRLGKVNVELTVATALSPTELESVKQRISQSLGKQAIVSQRLDPGVLGGLVVRVQDKLLDASVRTQLKSIKKKMLAART